eukprot:9503956-Pyramimonas_sp.AAC.1
MGTNGLDCFVAAGAAIRAAMVDEFAPDGQIAIQQLIVDLPLEPMPQYATPTITTTNSHTSITVTLEMSRARNVL